MQTIGIDFTSSPRKAKPVVCAVCELKGERLELREFKMLESFIAFEDFLNTESEWLCGVDAPFAQPRKLIEDLRSPLSWSGYVKAFAEMGREGFVRCLNAYRENQPTGQKEHLREVDRLAKAISPMKLYGVPVGKMFFELAPRLLETSLNIPALRPTSDKRTVIEVYPSLVARALIGKRSYKNDAKEQQTREKLEARALLVEGLESSKLQTLYGVTLLLTQKQKVLLVNDAKGDMLDACFAAIQTAWASSQENYGIPADVDGLEGWIADPSLRFKVEE
jgi:predicted RNase H-like nuclease